MGFDRQARVARGFLPALLPILSLLLFVETVAAATPWVDWTTATAGAPGSASGSLDGVTVTYVGEVLDNTLVDGRVMNWAPDSTFTGVSVTESPAVVGDIITLSGSSGDTNTLSFGSPVENPIIAIWSLGSELTGTTASFLFAETPIFVAGGPNATFGGSEIEVSGNVVSGQEGNGVVKFTGTFSEISWTNTSEYWFGFTVGLAAVPEPRSLPSLGSLAYGLLTLLLVVAGASCVRTNKRSSGLMSG